MFVNISQSQQQQLISIVRKELSVLNEDRTHLIQHHRAIAQLGLSYTAKTFAQKEVRNAIARTAEKINKRVGLLKVLKRSPESENLAILVNVLAELE